jgi:hypothetical protein
MVVALIRNQKFHFDDNLSSFVKNRIKYLGKLPLNLKQNQSQLE